MPLGIFLRTAEVGKEQSRKTRKSKGKKAETHKGRREAEPDSPGGTALGPEMVLPTAISVTAADTLGSPGCWPTLNTPSASCVWGSDTGIWSPVFGQTL